MGYRRRSRLPRSGLLDPATNILTQGTNVGPTSPTVPNLIDVSGVQHAGVFVTRPMPQSRLTGATNPTAYYRSIAEVDAGAKFYPIPMAGSAFTGWRQLPRCDEGRTIGCYPYSVEKRQQWAAFSKKS